MCLQLQGCTSKACRHVCHEWEWVVALKICVEVLHVFKGALFNDVKKKTLCLRSLKSWQASLSDTKRHNDKKIRDCSQLLAWICMQGLIWQDPVLLWRCCFLSFIQFSELNFWSSEHMCVMSPPGLSPTEGNEFWAGGKSVLLIFGFTCVALRLIANRAADRVVTKVLYPKFPNCGCAYTQTHYY